MFSEKLNEIVTYLKTQNELFEFGVYKDRFDPSVGINDNYPYYFYIADDVDGNDDNSVWEENDDVGSGGYLITGRFKLIAAFKSVNLELATKLLAQQLCDFDVTINAASTDSEAIYKSEYPDEKHPFEMDILRLKFSLDIYADFPFCQDNICLSDCL